MSNPDYYFITPRVPQNNPGGAHIGSSYIIRAMDGRVVFPTLKLDQHLAQEICDELNTCRDASTAR